MQGNDRPADPGAITEDDLKSLREALQENVAEWQAAQAEREAQTTAEQQDDMPAQAENPEKSPQTD